MSYTLVVRLRKLVQTLALPSNAQKPPKMSNYRATYIHTLRLLELLSKDAELLS